MKGASNKYPERDLVPAKINFKTNKKFIKILKRLILQVNIRLVVNQSF
jgi:hypothetical protein